MSEPQATNQIRFGRTVIEVVVGELADQPVQGLVFAANTRGVMGAGPSGSLRSSAGPEVEREAMGHAPIELGAAVATQSGRLLERGISVIFHAAVVSAIGEHAVNSAIFRSLDSALRLASDRKLHSLALPLLGVSADDPEAERRVLAEGIVDVVVKALRRRGGRLERIIFVVRFQDDQAMLRSVVQRARERVWTTSA